MYYECLLNDDTCPHFDPVFGICTIEADIGKPPTEYNKCEAYESDETPTVFYFNDGTPFLAKHYN